jgi:hypothetical protein
MAGFINLRFGQIATQRYMQDGPNPNQWGQIPKRGRDPGPLRKITERLAQAYRSSIKGGEREAETIVRVTGNQGQLTWTKIITVGYAALHEKGGSFSFDVPITERMRGFFYAKTLETGGKNEFNMWWRLYLASLSRSSFHIDATVPARPVAEPAVNDVEPEVVERAGQRTIDLLAELSRAS